MQYAFTTCHILSIFCKIIQRIYSNSSADLYFHNSLFEPPVTLVIFVEEAVYQKLLVDCLLKLSQM